MPRIVIISRCAWTLYNFRLNHIKKLKSQGWDVIAIGAHYGDYGDELKREGVEFIPIPLKSQGTNIIVEMLLIVRFYRLFRRLKPDVVHSFTIKPVIYGNIATRLARISVVVNTITGLGYAFTKKRKILSIVVSGMYRIALKKRSHIFFQNKEDVKEFIDKKIINDKTAYTVVPGSGVDLKRFYPESEPHETFTVAMISRIVADKGVREYVEAVRKLKESGSECKFIFVGGEDNYNPSAIPSEELEKWKEEGSISWLGHVKDVRSVISSIDLVVLPSYREGLPRSLLEANAMGLAVVATDVPGCREIVKHNWNGLLIPLGSGDELANAIDKLSREPDLCFRLGQNGLALVRDNYSEELVINKALDIYNKYLSDSFLH